MGQRFVCVHGHFYQPPRENPWTGEVERQRSASPHHDWNSRITGECYRPNVAARILDDAGRPTHTIVNYARMSFNFGPTLLAWLEIHAPDVYRAVIEADRSSRGRFGGHGAAIAQVFNHMIVPLACERDRRCQIAWGLRDFEHRFERRAEGMWLPETAVDLRTLEALAAAGVRFTILAPHQATHVRAPGAAEWLEVGNEGIDTTRAYEQVLPSGARIALYFYHGPVSRAVAFERLLDDGKGFADRLAAIVPEGADDDELAHIATDGESYGHHHEFGEMALAWALEHLDREDGVRLTHYAEFLAEHPPEYEVRIAENTSWSCSHGIERWRGDCGCGSAAHAGWVQAWRGPLREAFDGLRDRLVPEFERRAGRICLDPWAAREAYVDVLLDPGGESWEAYLETHCRRAPSAADATELRKLMELQRFAMLMYTSCGWFFEDLARIEPLQILRYAGRAIELARELEFDDPEPEFVGRLALARSNRPERGTAADLYRRHVTRREPLDADES